MKALLLAVSMLFLASGAHDNVVVLFEPGGGGGGGTDYTADGDFYELWNFDGTVGVDVCDGVVNSNDLSQSGTPTRETSTGLVEGTGAMNNNNGPNGCTGTLPGSPPTGSWTIGWRFYPTEGPTFIQKILSVNGNGTEFNLQANTATLADWFIAGGAINNQHTYAINTQYSIVVHYDGADLDFWWDGGSGGDCSGSTYSSTLDPDDITSIEVGNAQGGDWGGVVDELFLTGQTFTQTDACNYHQDGIDGAGLP